MGKTKFENVSLIPTLRKFMEKRTTHWQEDFQIDVKRLKEYAGDDEPDHKHMLYMLREHGTWLHCKADVFNPDTAAYDVWTYSEYYNAYRKIDAYEIEITGRKGSAIYGNVKKISFKKTVDQIRGGMTL